VVGGSFMWYLIHAGSYLFLEGMIQCRATPARAFDKLHKLWERAGDVAIACNARLGEGEKVLIGLFQFGRETHNG